MSELINEALAAVNEYVAHSDSKPAYTFRGAALAIQSCTSPEWIIEGPAETGKTLAALWRMHEICKGTPGVKGAFIRKVHADIYTTALRTYLDKIITPGDVEIYGGEKPQWFTYKNGSRITVGGMDNPGKVLSGELDFAYVNQAEELTLNDWETLTTRTTGRAGNLQDAFLCGDANPRGQNHWILQRVKAGSLRIFHSKHVDNPMLYTDDGMLTEQGKRTMETLEKLTGMRRERLLMGKWAQAEGLVYEQFSREIHVQQRNSLEFAYWVLGCDEGYTNPAVLLLIGIDGDGRIHVAREFYETGKLQGEVVGNAVAWSRLTPLAAVVVDASAPGLIADMANNGLPAEAHKGRVLDGIHTVQAFLAIRGDRRPGITVDPSCVNTINEFESYTWKTGKDEPVKENDHALDALRYACDYLTAPQIERQVIYSPMRIGNY